MSVLTVADRGNMTIVTRTVMSAKDHGNRGTWGAAVALATTVVGSGG